MPDSRTVARRVKSLRQRQGKSLRAVAELAGISAGHLSRIERGERELDSLSVLVNLADVLGVAPEELAGAGRTAAAPARSACGDRADRLAVLMPPIRAALDLTDLAADESIRPRSVRELTVAVRRVNLLAQAARYEQMSKALADLLAELHTATHAFTGREQETAWGLLAEACRC